MSVEQAEVPAGSEKGLTALPAHIRDGYELHQAALRRGLNVVLYPRQVLMAAAPANAGELSFIHGVPESSTLGAVTYSQDKRMRRALLERAGLPVPKGATFSVGRGIKDAKNYAERIGFPVVVKPAMGDNAIETMPGIVDEEQLDEAIEYLRTPPPERAAHTRAAYALTELREPGEQDGRVVVPPGYRFLIEEHVRGQYVRFFVVNGDVCSVVLLGAPPGAVGTTEHKTPEAGTKSRGRDVTGETHSTLKQLAVDAMASLPGLAVGAVDVVVADHQQPVSSQDLWVVEMAERPGLAVLAWVDDDLSRVVGDAILAAHASECSVELPDVRDDVTVDFHAEAIPEQESAVAALADAARHLGLAGHIGVTDRVEGVVDGVLQGRAAHVAYLAEALLDGALGGHGLRAMLVEERHRESEPLDGFVVR